MPRRLDPVVGQANPNLYAAAIQANLAPQDQAFMEQMSFTAVQTKRLRALPLKQAKREYSSLSKEAKAWIDYLFPGSEFAKPEPTMLEKAVDVAKTGAKGVLSFIATPVVKTFELAGEYGKAINTPYSVLRQAYQKDLIGKVRFGSPTATSQQGVAMGVPKDSNGLWAKAWKAGYNGKNLYDDGAVDVAKKKYGDVRVFVAQKILEGKKPGEILEEYGQIDDKISAALSETLNDPTKWGRIIEDVKFAQTSPARDIGRMLERIGVNNGSPLGKFIAGTVTRATGGQPTLDQEEYKKQIRKATGYFDAMYQIMIDPLTYVTGGTTKALTPGQKLVENLIQIQARTGSLKASIKELFDTTPEIRELWDGKLGNLIEKHANAPTRGDKLAVERQIKDEFPAYADSRTIKLFSSNGIFNANSAQEFFGQFENLDLFISGRVDGISYYRNGIVTARDQRQITLGIARAADAIFNPSSRNLDAAERASKVNKLGGDTVGILKSLGDDVTQGVNVEGLQQIIKQEEDYKVGIKSLVILSRQIARNPGGNLILTGEDAIKTEGNFRLVAQQLFERDIADFVTDVFVESSRAEQIVMLRNLYAGVMYKMGLHGIPRGNEIIEEVLSKTFNNKSGTTTAETTEITEEFANVINKNIIRDEDGLLSLEARGIIHPSQRAEGIAPLPYERIIQAVARARITKNNKNILKIVDGATRNKLVAELVNVWTILTLIPRLGVRSAIDEAFFYAFNAPLADLYNYASGMGRRIGAVTTGYTGSLGAVGPIKQAFNALFRKGGPRKTLSGEQRAAAILEIAEKKGISVEEVTHMMIREEIADRIIAVWGKDETINFDYIKQALVNNEHFLTSMANSLGARTSLSGSFDREIMDSIFTVSVLTKALNDAELKAGRKFRPLSTEALKKANPKWLTLAHFDAFYLRFPVNSMGLPNNRTVNPAVVFFSHNGLRTGEDFLKAKRDMLEAIGVSFDKTTETYFIKDIESTQKFMNEFGDSLYFKNKGLKDADIAEAMVDTMLYDMRYTFHGSGNKFNEKLMTLVKDRYEELVKLEKQSNRKIPGKWEKAVANLPFEEFEKATAGFQPRGRINTAIEFIGDEFQEKETFLTLLSKFGEKSMEFMDRQVTGIFRQPALSITYSRLRTGYANLEKEFVDQLVAIEVKNAKDAAKGQWKVDEDAVARNAEANAKKIAQKRFTEIALNEAVESILKYVDNPNVRSNFTLSVRNVARFYRATEDFWRRYYRLMREKPLQVIYRMRLAHQGLEARGDIYTDEFGEDYLVIPTDSIINAAVEPVVRQLTGSDFVVPQFNDFTLKLRMVNPSFSPDAGAPVLSGPISGALLVQLRSLLGKLPGQAGIYGTKAGEFIDNWALGDFGDNMDLPKALIPLQLQNIWKMIPTKELSRQEASAQYQSIAYVQAFGDKNSRLPENATPEQFQQFLRSHRIAVHNLQFIRGLFGMFSPVTLTPRESKGVPDYYKNNGLVTLRQEFFDILNTINKETFGTVYDPFEVALAIFNGKNPGKTVYTISRNERKVQFIIQKTNEVVDWAIENKSFREKYGDAAWIFAPQIGEYTPDSFSYLESLDIVEKPSSTTVEKYLEKMQTSVVKQRYFDIERREREALSKNFVISDRRRIIYEATRERQALLNAYPLLKVQLTEQGISVAEEELLLENVQAALVDRSTPISDIQRKKVSIAVKLVRDFISFANDEAAKRDTSNFVEAKRMRREQIESVIQEMMFSDNQIKELNRKLLGPILSFYSRDVYRTIGGR
jgi:hypothetical protein